MKKTLLTIALCAGLLAASSTEALAQRPGRGEREKQRNERTDNSRGGNNRHNGAGHSSNSIKPNNNSNHNNKKEKPNRPSGNKDNNSYTRPGRQPQAQPGHRPAAPGRPNGPIAPGGPARPVPGRPVAPVRPVRPVAPVRPMRPAYRPGRPIYQPWIRPIRPAAWRPVRVIPAIRPLFGLNFGMGINLSITMLNNNGYTVQGYGNEVIYLNNVNELNYIWPEGMLYYENGGLARTQLYYSTPNYDTRRYGNIYSKLYAQYGSPVSTNLPGGGVQATWFSNDGSYVQLEFSSRPTYGGSNQFFTTLTFGN